MSKLLYIVLIFLLVSCSRNPKMETDRVIVSILPLQYFVDQIAGEELKTTTLVPPGASPATYEPTARQLKEISNARIYFQVGPLIFEKVWKDRFLEINPHLKIIDLSENILPPEETIHHHVGHHHGIDPHIWMSPEFAKKMVSKIFQILVKIKPEQTNYFQTNYDSLLGKIQEIDSLLLDNTSQLTHRSFLIFHPALTYLAKDYGLHQIEIEHEGKEPSPDYLKGIINTARDQNVKVIFVQQEFNKENAKVVAEEINAQIVEINPLGYNWENNMRDIIEKLKLLDHE